MAYLPTPPPPPPPPNHQRFTNVFGGIVMIKSLGRYLALIDIPIREHQLRYRYNHVEGRHRFDAYPSPYPTVAASVQDLNPSMKLEEHKILINFFNMSSKSDPGS
jgi:hypothetical protein